MAGGAKRDAWVVKPCAKFVLRRLERAATKILGDPLFEHGADLRAGLQAWLDMNLPTNLPSSAGLYQHTFPGGETMYLALELDHGVCTVLGPAGA